MVRHSKPNPSRARPVGSEHIFVSALRDINIHFPGDVYVLAVWTVTSNLAKSTAMCHQHTTLRGLAGKFVSMYGIDYARPLDTDEVMEIFHRHGISGNPILLMDEEPLEWGLALFDTQDRQQPFLALPEKAMTDLTVQHRHPPKPPIGR